jgi:hypothetical protein
MKVALCFAGFIEELEDTKEFWNRIISKHDVDVYASFWKRNDNEVEEFIKLYNPKKIEIEDYSAFENTTQKLAANQIEPPGPPYSLHPYLQERAKEFRQIPIWYKIWRSNLLAGNENYDVVIRARTDIKLDDSFELIQNNMLNIPIGITSVDFWPDSSGFNDLFAFGPQDIMNYYSLLYIHLMDYVQRGHYAFPPEHTLAVHLSNTSVQIRYFPSYITIVRESTGNENLVYNRFITTPYEDVIWSNTMKFEPHPEIIFKKQ